MPSLRKIIKQEKWSFDSLFYGILNSVETDSTYTEQKKYWQLFFAQWSLLKQKDFRDPK